MKKVEKYIYIVLIIILIAVLASTTTYFVVKNNNTEMKEKDNKPDKKEEQNNKDEFIELDLENKLVKDLFEFLKINNRRDYEVGFHEGRKITYDDLKNKEAIAYRYREPSYSKVVFKTCEDVKEYSEYYNQCKSFSEISTIDSSFFENHGLFKADDFEKIYKEIYGNDKSLERKSFEQHPFNAFCEYNKEKDIYLDYSLPGGGGPDGMEFLKLVKAEKNSTFLILYDYFMYESYCDYVNLGIYKDVKQKEFVIFSEDIEDYDKYFEENYKNFYLYKHVFEANGDGTYHWVSSEPVDSLD